MAQFIFLSASAAFSQITFYEHNISNSFAQAVAVHANDMNNDGFVDIIGGALSNKIYWWQNDGSQNFTEHIISENAAGVRGIYTDDINQDGTIDVVAAAWTGNAVIWYENTGQGNFTEHIVDDSFTGAHTVETCDVNQDGYIDILASSFDIDNQSFIAWWENDGNENFTKHVISGRFMRSPFIHGNDIDLDGDIDILACGETKGEVLWWENDGNENFTSHMIDGGYTAAHTVFARDVDQDGDMDILGAACLSHQFTWWENDGAQNFTKHPVEQVTCALWIDALDLDDDGDNDLIGTGTTGAFWWENDGSQNFTQHELEGNFGDGYCLIASDIDQDEDFDLIGAGRASGKITWWENSLYMYRFDANQTTGHAPLTVNFSDISTSPFEITSWNWDFDNDGNFESASQSTNWTYETPGIYSVKLEVGNDTSTTTVIYSDYIKVFDGQSALSFDGTSSVVTVSASDDLNLTDNFSMEAWIKPAGWGEIPTIGFGRILDKVMFSIYLINSSSAFNNHSLAFQISHANGTNSITMSQENSISLDQWQHIAVSYQASESSVKIYVNGVDQELFQTVAPSGPVKDNSLNNLFVGNNIGNNFSFEGIIDNVRIWNRVRTVDEITADFNQLLYGNESGLAAYWKMDEGTGDDIEDNSTNTNIGTIAGAAWTQGKTLSPATSVDDLLKSDPTPVEYQLNDNFPNPFNPETTISFLLPEATFTKLEIFDISGRLVKTILNQNLNKGSYLVKWNGKDESDTNAGSGLYLYKLTTNNFTQTRKMTFLK